MDRALADVSVDTTPFNWYADPAVLAAERERIFRRSWQYAGHTGELDGPGSFFPTQVGGLPVIVALDNDGRLRGYLNICRHRGTVLVDEPQKRGTIQCPYHAWTYGLDGSLRGAPRSKDEPGFEAATMLNIHPDECIDCGACVPACPVEAIFALDEVPDKWRDYIQKNADHYKK